jgi:predicted alpha/beta superfamily hydrolase
MLRLCRPALGHVVAFAFAPLALAAQSPGPVAPPPDPIPAHQTFTIDSRAVAERRTINVYTPPAYEASPGQAFPVVYMPDGGLEEDFPHIVNTIDSLIALGVIRPMLVVGIENTERRRDLTGPTTVATDSAIAPHVGGSGPFRRFIADELMPEVRSRYRCTDETTIVGESLAGLFIVESFLMEPRLFHRYIALSPSLWWNGGELVRSAAPRLAALAGIERTLFLASANEENIVATTAALAATLAVSAPPGLTWRYEPRPDLQHSTIFRAVVPGAFAEILR